MKYQLKLNQTNNNNTKDKSKAVRGSELELRLKGRIRPGNAILVADDVTGRFRRERRQWRRPARAAAVQRRLEIVVRMRMQRRILVPFLLRMMYAPLFDVEDGGRRIVIQVRMEAHSAQVVVVAVASGSLATRHRRSRCSGSIQFRQRPDERMRRVRVRQNGVSHRRASGADGCHLRLCGCRFAVLK